MNMLLVSLWKANSNIWWPLSPCYLSNEIIKLFWNSNLYFDNDLESKNLPQNLKLLFWNSGTVFKMTLIQTIKIILVFGHIFEHSFKKALVQKYEPEDAMFQKSNKSRPSLGKWRYVVLKIWVGKEI